MHPAVAKVPAAAQQEHVPPVSAGHLVFIFFPMVMRWCAVVDVGVEVAVVWSTPWMRSVTF
jgi:hypothetical protein